MLLELAELKGIADSCRGSEGTVTINLRHYDFLQKKLKFRAKDMKDVKEIKEGALWSIPAPLLCSAIDELIARKERPVETESSEESE